MIACISFAAATAAFITLLLLPTFMADARQHDSMKQCDEKSNRTLYIST